MTEFISFSGGVESSAMCVLMGNRADAIFADTGWEHREIYERIGLVERKVRKIHGNDFKIHRIKARVKYKGKIVDNLKDYIRLGKYYPSPMSRYCTRIFKIEPIDDFLREFDKVTIHIGLNYDERDRKGNHGLLGNVSYKYPLILNHITRDGCKKILDHAGLLPNFPVYMQRGGCVGCFFKSKREFYAMAQMSPEEFDEVVAIEKEIQDERGKFYAVRDGIKSMDELGKFARTSMFTPEDIYGGVEQPETPCGVFCNR